MDDVEIRFNSLVKSWRELMGKDWPLIVGYAKEANEHNLVITPQIYVVVRSGGYVLCVGSGNKIGYVEDDINVLMNATRLALGMDCNYQSYLSNKIINEKLDNILLKLDALSAEVKYHPAGNIAESLKKDFTELSLRHKKIE